jgi:hypothetical protein
VHARSGDAALAISELQVFSEVPASLPTPAVIVSAVPFDDSLRDKLVLFGWALLIPLLLVRGTRAVWVCSALSVPIWAGVELGRALWSAWPVAPREVSLLRAMIAAVAAAAVAREISVPSACARCAASSCAAWGCAVCSLSLRSTTPEAPAVPQPEDRRLDVRSPPRPAPVLPDREVLSRTRLPAPLRR